MPEGGLIPVRKVGNRSVTIYRYKAVRCQLLYSFGGFVGVFVDAREGAL
jgi:hypothetical protein